MKNYQYIIISIVLCGTLHAAEQLESASNGGSTPPAIVISSCNTPATHPPLTRQPKVRDLRTLRYPGASENSDTVPLSSNYPDRIPMTTSREERDTCNCDSKNPK